MLIEAIYLNLVKAARQPQVTNSPLLLLFVVLVVVVVVVGIESILPPCVTGYALPAMRYRLCVTGYALPAMRYRLCVTGYALPAI